MMINKVEVRPNKPRDGRHCDLCGCSQPAVRCDKCGCQIFCLSCDDMYHRHPKRRFHLRKAVDPTPPTTQARPVLPMKVAHLPMSPGDPSKMPLPPPRKKKPVKAFFDTFRKQSPSSDNSPPLPRKEYSWTDRLGSIKKFMSNRPLPPLPNDNFDKNHEDFNNSSKNDLSFIHKKVEEKAPQLPQRTYKPQDIADNIDDKENLQRRFHGHGHHIEEVRNGVTNGNHIENMNGHDGNPWSQRMMGNQMPHHQLNTMNRQNHFQQGSSGYPPGMSQTMPQSASTTDLQNLPGMEGFPRQGMPPHYPQYPMNAPYPYPMYPQYPNYQPYFGNSFANLSSHPPTTDGDFSDHSESSSRHPSSKRYSFQKKAKRSQSVMVDRMGYPGQFYPFGPYPPGYAPQPWSPPYHMGTPPSPASSIRSLNRIGRSRRRRKVTSDDDDEEFSMSSSPLSRPKSSSSERPTQGLRKAPLATQSSSMEESDEEIENTRNRDRKSRKHSDPKRLPSPVVRSPQVTKKKLSKVKKKEVSPQHESQEPETTIIPTENQTFKGKTPSPQPPLTTVLQSDDWHCKHCTFLNSYDSKICQVCYKTASPVDGTPVALDDQQPIQDISRTQTVSPEEIRQKTPESKKISKVGDEEDQNATKDKQDMENLNSALDEAEKEITRGLEELMKLKEDFDLPQQTELKNETVTSQKPPVGKDNSDNSKPVYKSTGKMRTNLLDKLSFKASEPATKSTTTETQTSTTLDASNRQNDRIIEARRASTSSASDAYNSPVAQSPELDLPPSKQNQVRKDSSCQTQQDELIDYLERKKFEEESYFGRSNTGYGYRYGDRMDMMTSPVPSMYDRSFAPGYGMMNRSHSRASLFTGRLNDPGPMDFVPTPMYRSVSRSSLTGDFPEGRFSEFHNLRKPDYYLSMEELVERRRQEQIRAQGLELVRMIREAEQQGFTADDIQVALSKCGKQNPLEWLQENWGNMVENVVNLSTNYGNDRKENDIGAVSEAEARDSLRMHKGNIWAAVTECVESRQRKFFELKARGKFSSRAITEALTAAQGDVGLAYDNLAKNNSKSSKPFLMRIWGAGEGAQNQDGVLRSPSNESLRSEDNIYRNKNNLRDYDVLSDDIWTEDEDVEWEEDGEDVEDEPEQGDIDDLQTCREDLAADALTPESDKSDYCDAFGTNTLDRMSSLPSDEEFFIIPDVQKEKKRSSLISKLASLRKIDTSDNTENYSKDIPLPTENKTATEANTQSDQSKNLAPLSIIKSTISAIRDSVSGTTKNEKKQPNVAVERRTIIVGDKIIHEKQQNKQESPSPVSLTSIKPVLENEPVITTKEKTTKELNHGHNSDVSKSSPINSDILNCKSEEHKEKLSNKILETEKSFNLKSKSSFAQEKLENNCTTKAEKPNSKTETTKTDTNENKTLQDKMNEIKVSKNVDTKVDTIKESKKHLKLDLKKTTSIDTKQNAADVANSAPASVVKKTINEISTKPNDKTEVSNVKADQTKKPPVNSVNEFLPINTSSKNLTAKEITINKEANGEILPDSKMKIENQVRKNEDKVLKENNLVKDDVINSLPDFKKNDDKGLKEKRLKNDGVNRLPEQDKNIKPSVSGTQLKVNIGSEEIVNEKNTVLNKEISVLSKNEIKESTPENLNLPNNEQLSVNQADDIEFIDSVTISDENVAGTSNSKIGPHVEISKSEAMHEKDKVVPTVKNELEENKLGNLHLNSSFTHALEGEVKENKTLLSETVRNLDIKIEDSNFTTNQDISVQNHSVLESIDIPKENTHSIENLELNIKKKKKSITNECEDPQLEYSKLAPVKAKIKSPPLSPEINYSKGMKTSTESPFTTLTQAPMPESPSNQLERQESTESPNDIQSSIDTLAEIDTSLSSKKEEIYELPAKTQPFIKEKEFVKIDSQTDSNSSQTHIDVEQNVQINKAETSVPLIKREQTDSPENIENVNLKLQIEKNNVKTSLNNQNLDKPHLENVSKTSANADESHNLDVMDTKESTNTNHLDSSEKPHSTTTLQGGEVTREELKIEQDDFIFHEPVSSKIEKIANSKLVNIQTSDKEVVHNDTTNTSINVKEMISLKSPNSTNDPSTSFAHSVEDKAILHSTTQVPIETAEHVKSSANETVAPINVIQAALDNGDLDENGRIHSKESINLSEHFQKKDFHEENANELKDNQEISKSEQVTKDIKSVHDKVSITEKDQNNSSNSVNDFNQKPQTKQETIQSTIAEENSTLKSTNLVSSSDSHIPSSSTAASSTTVEAINHHLPVKSKITEEKTSESTELNIPTTSATTSNNQTSSDLIPPQISDSDGINVSEKKIETKKHGILKRTPSTEGHAANKVSFSAENVEIALETESLSEPSAAQSTPAANQTSEEDSAITTDENDSQNESVSLGSSNTSSRRSSVTSITPPSPVDALRNRFEGLIDDSSTVVRPHSPFRRMSFNSRKAAIALERTRDSSIEKSWISQKPKYEPPKPTIKRTLKQQLEVERKIRKLVSDRKCRTYKKAEIIIQLMDMNFEEDEAIQAANECATLEQAISYLQQECLLCTGYFPVSHIISMVHCPHMACRECIRAYFTVQIRDRNIMELLCPFCNEPDLTDEDIAQDYFNHLDIMLKKLVDEDIHELFQRKLRDRVLMRDPCFRWCSKCSSGFIAMPNLKQLICPDCNAVTCASCRRPWEREHQGISCEAFAAWKDATDPEAQTLGLAKLLTEDGIDCPRCHFRYALAKGGCMHFRCIQCQHDFCSGCSRPFKMGQKCGVSEFCIKLGLHAHHPRNCLFYLRDKDPEDLQRLLDLSGVKYDTDPPEGMEVQTTCHVMEQKETADGMVDDYCGKDVENSFAGLCRIHYVEYLGQLVNKNKVDPIQIFEKDDLELVLRRANVRLPPKRYRETDEQYREKLVNLIQEELPIDKIEGS